MRRPSDRNQQSSSSSEDTEDIQRDIQTSRISGASSYNEDEDISPPPVTFKKVILLSGILGIRRWMMKKPERVGTLGYLLQQPPKFSNNAFSNFGLATLGHLLDFDWLIHEVKCPNVSTTNRNHHWGCTSIYQPLSLSF